MSEKGKENIGRESISAEQDLSNYLLKKPPLTKKRIVSKKNGVVEKDDLMSKSIQEKIAGCSAADRKVIS